MMYDRYSKGGRDRRAGRCISDSSFNRDARCGRNGMTVLRDCKVSSNGRDSRDGR